MSIARSQIVSAARDWIGTPYRHQASLKGVGSDCLGLMRGVWRELVGEEPEALPAYSPHWAESTRREQLFDVALRHLIAGDRKNLVPGDVLLFRLRPDLPAKHCGFYVGDQRMVHAQERVGTVETSLGPWWQKRLCASFQFPDLGD